MVERPPLPEGFVALSDDTHFKFGSVDLDGEPVYWAQCLSEWVNEDVLRFREIMQPKIDGGARFFVMDLRAMEEITLSARYETARWMKGNRGKVHKTAVICKDAMQRFTLQTLLRVARRKNVYAVGDNQEALSTLR